MSVSTTVTPFRLMNNTKKNQVHIIIRTMTRKKKKSYQHSILQVL
jgi:hypothetical protein